MKKQKLMMIIQPGDGGSVKHLCDLLRGLDLDKFELVLLYNRTLADESFKSCIAGFSSALTAYSIDEMGRELSFSKDWSAYRQISQLIKREKPDIVHCHSSKAGVLGRLAAKRRGVKKIFYTAHGYAFLQPEFSSKKRQFFIVVERFLSRFATDKTFNTSFGEKEAALKVHLDKPEKFVVIYNGLAPQKFLTKEQLREQLGLPQEAYLFGNVARLVAQKNPFFLIELAKKVAERDRAGKIQFVWIGGGELEQEMLKQVKENGLVSRVHLLGFKADAAELMPAFDAFFSPSFGESFGYAPVEALRAGVPVFLSHVMGHREIVIPNRNGQLFDLAQLEQHPTALFDFIEWSKSVKKEEIVASFEERFSLKQMAEKISREYLR